MRQLVSFLLASAILLFGTAATRGAWAGTTTINFDSPPSGSPANFQQITTQYQSVGVTFSGAQWVAAMFTLWVNPFGANDAYSSGGLMTVTLDPSVIGNVQSFSTYVSSVHTVTVQALDSTNASVGTATVPANSTNQLITISSPDNPITKVQFQGQAGDYVLDDLTFKTGIAFSSFTPTVFISPALSSFAATESFTLAANSTALTPPTQPVTLTIGSLSIDLPTGSFVKDLPPRASSYVYRGQFNGTDIYVSISPTKKTGVYSLFVLGTGYKFQRGLATIPVSLVIGDNSGNTTVAPHYVNVVPYGP